MPMRPLLTPARLSHCVGVVMLCALLASCSRVEVPRPTPQPSAYRLVVDDASFPLVRALARVYHERQPWVMFTIDQGNMQFVREQIGAARAQLGVVGQLPPDIGAGWWLTDLAMDGVAVIVHEQNTMQNLSLADARAIFAGERNQWTDYSVNGLGDIKVAVREGGEATRTIFDNSVMGAQRLTFDALLMPSADVMLRYVALNPGAIGYVPFSRVTQQKLAVRTVRVEGVAPSPETIASGEYALAFAIYFVAAQEPQEALRDFVLWALSDEGKQVARALGYTPLP